MVPTTKSALETRPEKSEHPELQANALQPLNCCGGDSLRNNKPSYGRLEFEPKFTFLLSGIFKGFSIQMKEGRNKALFPSAKLSMCTSGTSKVYLQTIVNSTALCEVQDQTSRLHSAPKHT